MFYTSSPPSSPLHASHSSFPFFLSCSLFYKLKIQFETYHPTRSPSFIHRSVHLPFCLVRFPTSYCPMFPCFLLQFQGDMNSIPNSDMQSSGNIFYIYFDFCPKSTVLSLLIRCHPVCCFIFLFLSFFHFVFEIE